MGSIRQEVRDSYLRDHSDDESLLTPFLSGFFVTWARVRKEYNALLKVFFMLPEDYMKEAYGFENEIMLVYAPFKTMEPRTLQAVEQIYAQSPAKGRVETLNYFLVSDAENIREWLDTYTSSRQESRIIISFVSRELREQKGNAWFIRNRLNEQFFGRDLFNYSLPLVEDVYFFGRQQLIMEYLDSIKRQENKAIFGLRKTGKTSFLFKLKRLIEKEEIAVTVYVDCKQPSLRKSHWYELLEDIAFQLKKDLKIKTEGKYTDRKASRSFFDLINQIKKQAKKVCLFFDEIEYISFVAKLDKHWGTEFIDFWQTLWSCQSQLKNFSFIIAGVNPSVVETDMVNGVQNPLFGIVSHKYLTGFGEDETRTMIKTLGKRMGLQFTYDAISDIYKWYGGHPLLTRLACSWLNTILSLNKSKPIEISLDVFVSNREKCDDELMFYCGHVISELREFYSDEYYMFELLASNQILDFNELAENSTYVKHLTNYGIVRKDNNIFSPTIPVVLKYVGAELARKEGRLLISKIVEEKNRDKWIIRRKEEILIDVRVLERIIKKNNTPALFGIGSFPEPDEFMKIAVVKVKNEFSSFINTCNRCFVESIDLYGTSLKKKDYFWKEIKQTYPDLFLALHRVRVYRNERDHLELNTSVNDQFIKFIEDDLEGRPPSQIDDLYFVLQQRVLDCLLLGIQAEISRFS